MIRQFADIRSTVENLGSSRFQFRKRGGNLGFFATTVDGDVEAGPREFRGDAKPDSATSAGHQGDFVGISHVAGDYARQDGLARANPKTEIRNKRPTRKTEKRVVGGVGWDGAH